VAGSISAASLVPGIELIDAHGDGNESDRGQGFGAVGSEQGKPARQTTGDEQYADNDVDESAHVHLLVVEAIIAEFRLHSQGVPVTTRG
jgi:hypothetical protein